MKPIDQIYRERLKLLAKQYKSQAALAARLGKSPAQVSQWITAAKDSRTGTPRSMDRKTAREIEEKLGLPDGWMNQPIDIGQDSGSVGPDKPVVAQSMSHPPVTLPILISWEVVMSPDKMPDAPQDFMIEMPDGALEPKILQGERLWFRSARNAKPRNVVLIEADGKRWVRRYAEGDNGPEAQPLEPAYRSFKDFTILAVLYMRPQDSV